ncbi:GTP-binding protein CG1354-like protein [Chytridium lagenaria]|nr:GTP-binding protein CG1354-like protein [Chytridium lagenaria]
MKRTITKLTCTSRSFHTTLSPPHRPTPLSQDPGLLGRPSNNLKMGIVGLPNVGKSCLFNALTSSSVPSENYPFCTIDPTEARAGVADERFWGLVERYRPRVEGMAFLTVMDIAGLGLGNHFLANVKGTDGIYHLVRSFTNPGIVHVEGDVDPIRDIEIIRTELRLKDAEQITTTLRKRAGKSSTELWERELLTYVNHLLLDLDTDVRTPSWTKEETDSLNRLHLLSAKPVVYLVNLSEEDYVTQRNDGLDAVKAKVEKEGDMVVGFSGELEEYLAALNEEEKRETVDGLGRMYGVENVKSALEEILMHFFTCGEMEVRAWTVREGLKGPQAAAVIHSDFEKNFIAAEVFKYQDIVEFGSEEALKAAGRVMTKGKDAVIEDGDIVHFKLRR